MIFSARQLHEKCRKQNLPLYYCFIDLSKEFDTVDRSIIWKILLKVSCPEKFVGFIRSLHEGRVSFNGTLSEEIYFDYGIKQVTFLRPYLYHLFSYILFLWFSMEI